jgi:hypothetical protein
VLHLVADLVAGEALSGVLDREALFLQPQGGLAPCQRLLPKEPPAPKRGVTQGKGSSIREKRIEKKARSSSSGR